MKFKVIFLLVCLTNFSLAQNPQAYKIYTTKGKKVRYKKMVKHLAKKDIVLFGEQHNSAIAHWLQLRITKELATKRSLQLGAEMIEADNQSALNLYLTDALDQQGLDTMARLWPNYQTDYAPLVDFAKSNKLSFTATNIPRKYARMVYRSGFKTLDTLSATEKMWIAPLPIDFDPELPTYRSILEIMGSHGSPKLVMAQAIKDATMAHFILSSYVPGNLFIHYNGAFHSDYYEGIVWYLERKSPNLNYATLSTVTQTNVHKLSTEHRGKADFILVVDEDVTTTY